MVLMESINYDSLSFCTNPLIQHLQVAKLNKKVKTVVLPKIRTIFIHKLQIYKYCSPLPYQVIVKQIQYVYPNL